VIYRDAWFKRAATVHIGLEARYRSNADGYRFDVANQVFYPLPGWQIQSYVQLDAVFAAEIKTAMIFFKLIHLNEGLLVPGYYTTMFHPMLGRSFSFGIRWRMFN
jgi:hypothetical protein